MAIVEGLDVRGCVVVAARNVTIRNTRVRCGRPYPIRVDAGFDTRIEDVTIDGLGVGESVGIYGDNYRVQRANIFGVCDAIRAGDNVTVLDSYLHDFVTGGDCHSDGVQSTGGRNIVVQGTNIQHPDHGNAAIMLTPTFGPLDNETIADNVLNGGAFTVHAGGDPNEYATTRVVIRGNRFGRSYLYGVSSFGGGDITWLGNTWLDTGQNISA